MALLLGFNRVYNQVLTRFCEIMFEQNEVV
jgi:hypothetical protein